MVEPFQAVDGTVVSQQANYNYDQNPQCSDHFWLNPYFSFDTTNEVDFARTLRRRAPGQQLFQVDTGLEAPGLGCGQDIEAGRAAGTMTPQCWLVVVPREHSDQENPSGVTSVSSVVTSPLTPRRGPTGSPSRWGSTRWDRLLHQCQRHGDRRERAGLASRGQLGAAAVRPARAPTYSYLQTPTTRPARTSPIPTYGSVGMSVFSDPIPAGARPRPDNPVVYAPLTLSGVVVAFNIDRVPVPARRGSATGRAGSRRRPRIQNIYLTPRLVAKLLTQSYQRAIQDIATDKIPPVRGCRTTRSACSPTPTSCSTTPSSRCSRPHSRSTPAPCSSRRPARTPARPVEVGAGRPGGRGLAGRAPPDGRPGDEVNPYYSTNPAINPSGSPSAPRPRELSQERPLLRDPTGSTCTGRSDGSRPGPTSASWTGRPTP